MGKGTAVVFYGVAAGRRNLGGQVVGRLEEWLLGDQEIGAKDSPLDGSLRIGECSSCCVASDSS